MKSLLLFAFLSISFIQLHAQSECETDFTLENKKYFDELVRQAELDQSRGPDDIIEVPIVFYIETYNGTPVYNSANLNNVISQNNAYFASANVEFSICTIIFFENGTAAERIDHVIRIFIETSYSGCGVSYGGGNITINPNCNRPFKEIVGHEIGHELGLPHTHGYTNMGTTTELVDGSNCTTDGDRFCDTPADPNILYEVNGSCIYTGTRTDANGDSYNPDTHNLMSYARGGCPNHFSLEQNARIHSVAEAKGYYCCLTPEPETNDVSVCTESTATLTASIASGEIRWYDAPGGNLIHTGTTYTTPVLNTTKSYFLYGYEGCESDPVKVTVNVLPTGGVMSNISEQLTQFGTDSVSSYIYDVLNADSILYLSISFSELWSFNGEHGSEQLVFSVGGGGGDGVNSSNLTSIAAGNNKILLGVNNQTDGPSLWVSDGTAGGAELLIEWGNIDYRFSNFWITELNGSFIFELTRLPDENAEIWISDGTVAGTQMVVSLPNTSSFSINRFYNYNGKLYFIAASALYDLEPWVTDGTAAGTYMLKEINLGGSANPANFIEHNGMLFFTANDGVNGNELWKTDGTSENTERVTDINPDGNTHFTNFKSIDNYLYFYADNGLIGAEPYLTDGTSSGTVLIENINPSIGSYPNSFTKCNGSVYFLASSVQGEIADLYNYQPDTEILTQVKQFSTPGFITSEMVCYNNQLYFSSASEQNNFEPWVSDGTESGTEQWLDLNPGGSSYPAKFTAFKGELIFTARGPEEQFYHVTEENYHVCNGEQVTITTQNHTGTVSWYDAPVDGNLLATGYSFQSEALSNSISFWADLTIEGCKSERSEIPVSVTTIELNASITHETNPADGAIDLTVSGGIAPYLFDWNTDGGGDFDDEEDLTGLTPGTYEVTVIDSGGCMISALYEVFSIPELIVANINNVSCFGDSTGSIDISIAGGTPPFVYTWSNGAITQDIANLDADTYTFTVTDANGLSATVDIQIVEPEELLVSSTISQLISCFGENEGAFNLFAQGGTAPYQYAVNGSGFDTENVFSNLSSGEYIFEIADFNGCSVTDSLVISQPDELLFNDTLITDNPCSGQDQGSIDFNVTGGTPPYSYQLDGSDVELPIDGLSAGFYSLDVYDANGCNSALTFTINDSEEVVFNTGVINEPTCNGDMNGIVSVSVTAGVGPYQWSLTGGAPYTNFPPSSSATSILGLGAGSIEITVLSDNGCQSTQTLVLTEPDELIAIENETQSISCFGENDAFVEVLSQGGTPPYEYSFFGQAFDLNNIFENIGAGNHTYSVMDANNCLFIGEFIVTEPEALDYSLDITDEIGNEPGSIDLTVFGGMPPYTYDWDNDGSGDFDDIEDLENLAAGTYTVNVLDINNCGFSASAEVEFIVGVNEASVLSEINVFPNPTANDLIIEFGNAFNAQVDIQIYNVIGEVIYQKENFSDNRLEIDLSNEDPGIYLLKIFTENGLLVNQIIKQ